MQRQSVLETLGVVGLKQQAMVLVPRDSGISILLERSATAVRNMSIHTFYMYVNVRACHPEFFDILDTFFILNVILNFIIILSSSYFFHFIMKLLTPMNFECQI